MSYLRFLCLLSFSDTYNVVLLLFFSSSCVPYVADSLDCPFLNAPSAFFFCVFNKQIPRVAIKNNYIFQFNGILILATY